jgi:hypothetical protein
LRKSEHGGKRRGEEILPKWRAVSGSSHVVYMLSGGLDMFPVM